MMLKVVMTPTIASPSVTGSALTPTLVRSSTASRSVASGGIVTGAGVMRSLSANIVLPPSKDSDADVLLRIRLNVGGQCPQLGEERIRSAIHGRVVHEQAERSLPRVDLREQRIARCQHGVEPRLTRRKPAREIVHLRRGATQLGGRGRD